MTRSPRARFSRSTALNVFLVVGLAALLLLNLATVASAQGRRPRVSRDLQNHLQKGDTQPSRVIVGGTEEHITRLAARHGLRIAKRLKTGAVLEVPAGKLGDLTVDGDADTLSGDKIVRSQMAVTNTAIGADQVWGGGSLAGGNRRRDDWRGGTNGVTGEKVTVAVIDSGVANLPEFKGRLLGQIDFTGKGRPGDQWGHGTHVAGIIAAGKNQNDDTSGVAPGANIVSLKVLGANGAGYESDVIEAMDWATDNARRYRIRVLNLSLGAPVTGSWRDDELCQAAERAYRTGLVIVASAGNTGRTMDGKMVFGSISAPGNCPFVITAGALNTKGTGFRSDDVMATYSSKGWTRFDHLVKPDLVAPGNRILGLLAPGSRIARDHPEKVINGQLELSGTSMSAAVVSGSAALLVSKFRLGPEGVRFRLQLSAERVPGAAVFVEGAGRLNVLAALTLGPRRPNTSIVGEIVTAGHLAYSNVPRANGEHIYWGDDQLFWGDDQLYWGDDQLYWGDDQLYWGDDQLYWGDDQLYWGDDQLYWGDDQLYWGDDQLYWGDDQLFWGDDQLFWGDDQLLWGDDQLLWGDDQLLWGDDQLLWGDDQLLWGDDQLLWGD